jgi:16S rRNA (guanine966-N2)-methyltransferase
MARAQMRAPEGDATRPTADRTRETLFSMLTSRLGSFDDLTVADFFAGSGALGLEALSRRGAGDLCRTGPARDPPSAPISALHAQPSATCARRRHDAGTGQEPVDLVLLDPPYTPARAVAIDRLVRLGWIGEATWISLETAANEQRKIRACRRCGPQGGRITLLRLRIGRNRREAVLEPTARRKRRGARHGQEQADVGGAAVQRQVLRGKGASAPPMIPPTLNAIEIPV